MGDCGRVANAVPWFGREGSYAFVMVQTGEESDVPLSLCRIVEHIGWNYRWCCSFDREFQGGGLIGLDISCPWLFLAQPF
jgi:hypothetical protein